MPRPKTGTVERHLDHFDVRVSLPNGQRSLRVCLPPGVTREEAKAEAARLTALAWRVGAVLRTPEHDASGERMAAWVDRWLEHRREKWLASVEADRGRWSKWIAPHLQDRPVATIQRIEIERVVEDLDRRVVAGELSWKTSRHVWGILSKMFSDACRSKRLDLRVRDDNPALGVWIRMEPPPSS